MYIYAHIHIPGIKERENERERETRTRQREIERENLPLPPPFQALSGGGKLPPNTWDFLLKTLADRGLKIYLRQVFTLTLALLMSIIT